MFDNDGNKIGEEKDLYPDGDNQHSPKLIELSSDNVQFYWINDDRTNSVLASRKYDPGNQILSEVSFIGAVESSYSPISLYEHEYTNNYVVVWYSHYDEISYQFFETNGKALGGLRRWKSNFHFPEFIFNSINTNSWMFSYEELIDINNYRGRKLSSIIFDINGIIKSSIYELFSSDDYYLLTAAKEQIRISNNEILIRWKKYDPDTGFNYYAAIVDSTGKLIRNNLRFYDEYTHICELDDDKFLLTYNKFGLSSKYISKIPNRLEISEYNLIKPKNDDSFIDISIEFLWNSSAKNKLGYPFELTYDLYISSDNIFNNYFIIDNLVDTTFIIDTLVPGQTYYWKVLARNYYGDTLWSSNVNGFYVDPNATDIKEIISETPTEFKLFQNYPNPFNPTTTISYQIPDQALPAGRQVRNDNVVLIVYDILGKEIATLVNKNQPAGNYEVNFSAANLPSGVYYYQLKVGASTSSATNYLETKKMVFLK